MRFKILAFLLVLAFVPSAARATQRFEFGPLMSRCEPTGAAAVLMDAGPALGVTCTYMQRPAAGYGLDLVYLSLHRHFGLDTADFFLWDVSLSAVQTTAHVKLLAPGPAAPWVEVGAGGYLVFKDYAGLRPGQSSFEPGFFGSVGLDFDIASGARFGFDTSFHHVFYESEIGFDVTMYTLGAHLLLRP